MALESAIKPQVLSLDNPIFDSIANFVIAVDQRGCIAVFNRTCEKLFNVSREQVLNRPISQVIPYTGLMKVLKTGQPHIGRKFVLGNALFVVNRTPIIQDNRVVGAIGVGQEITELHQLAEELEEVKTQRSALESIFEYTDEGYISINNEGYINFVNQSMADFLKSSPGQLLNQHITEVIPETKAHLFQIGGNAQQNKMMQLAGENMMVSSFPVMKHGQVSGAVSKIYRQADLPTSSADAGVVIKPRKSNIKTRYQLDDIIGFGDDINQLKEMVRRVARGPSTVLITGESGTGKELFAHALHAMSGRAGGPFVKVNCAAIPENLLESELFGYREGAFTGSRKGGQVGKFEMAHRGTIFLDEIGDMPLAMQAKVLRVLQEKEIERLGDKDTRVIDVRVTAATNRDLEALIAAGDFREDLYYRLNVVNLHIPPLRDRKDDLEHLLQHFISKFNHEFMQRVHQASPQVLDLFGEYHWPGNVRELENIVERAFNLVESDVIEIHHLPHYLLKYKETQAKVPKKVDLTQTLPVLMESVEKEAIKAALVRTGGNKLQSAKLLGISRAWLYKKIKQYQIY